MEKVENSTQYGTDKAKSFLLCCSSQQKIHFDSNRKSKSCKLIPLNEDRSARDCPNQQRHWMTSHSSRISNDAATIQFEIAEKLLQGQKQLKLKRNSDETNGNAMATCKPNFKGLHLR
jgi:hypothetical protein